MNSLQRVIKYCAIAFAIMLTVGIISGIVNAVFAIVSVTSGASNFNRRNHKLEEYNETFKDVKSLDIDNATGELKIRIGETFQVEAQNVSKNFKAEVSSSGKLTIREDDSDFNFMWFHFNGMGSPNSKVTLYIPKEFVADEVKIESGAGSVSIEGLNTEYLKINAGAGNITGSNIIANKVKLDGGVGNIKVEEVQFADVDLDCGVGNIDLEGVMLGNNQIDCGVGDVDLDLTGNVDEYEFNIDAGVGTIRLNGDKISSSEKINSNADNYIKVDGGVGNVRIDIKE